MIQERQLRSNEKVNGQLDYQSRKIMSPQADVNFKKENSNPLDQNSSSYQLKGYERQASYKSNQFDQSHQTGEQLRIVSNNNPYLKQSVYNNNEQEQAKPFIRAYQEVDQRKPLDQVNQQLELRQVNERQITSPYGNLENKKRDPIETRTSFDPNINLSVYTPQSRYDNYRRDVQQSEQKREFQLPEYKRMVSDQESRFPQRQMSSFEMKQNPVYQGDRARYDQERIRTVGGQQEQPERMDRLIRASDYVRKPENIDIQEQDQRVLERKEFIQRGPEDQCLNNQRNNSKFQENSQRQQNLIRKPQEQSKTPNEGRINEKRAFDDQMQQDVRFQQSQFPNPYLEGRTQKQHFYDMKPTQDDQKRMLNPYDERRNINPYETRPQIQDQKPSFERRPDRVEFEKRQDRLEFERRLEQPEFQRRPEFENRSPYQARFGPEGKSEFDYKIPLETRQQQGYNQERFQQQGFRQDIDIKYHYEGRQAQKTQFQEIPANGPDGLQEVRKGMHYRKYSDGRSIQDGQIGYRDGLEGRPGLMEKKPDLEERRAGLIEGRPGLPEAKLGLMEGRPGQMEGRLGLLEGRPGLLEGRSGLPQARPGLIEGRFGLPEGRPGLIEGRSAQPEWRYGLPEGRLGLVDAQQQQADGRGGFNRTFGEDRYKEAFLLEGRTRFDGRRDQFGTKPPVQGRSFEERGTFEQRIPIESRNQYQRGLDDNEKYFEQKYSQQQDMLGRKDFGRPEYNKMREEIDRRNTYGRPEMGDNMPEFGKREEFDHRIRPQTCFGKPNAIGQQQDRREYNDQEQRLSYIESNKNLLYHEDTSVVDRLGLERGMNRKIIGNQAAENMLRGGQQINRQYDRERGCNRLGMGERMASFTNSKMGYQRTAFQFKEEYQGYVRSKLKSTFENDPNDFQRKNFQDQGFQKLQSPQGQVETKVGIYDIQRRDGRI